MTENTVTEATTAEGTVATAEGTEQTEGIVLGGKAAQGTATGDPRQDRANGDAKAKKVTATAARKGAVVAVGQEPGNAAGRAKFAALTKGAQASVRKAAVDAYTESALGDGKLTVAKAWAAALDAAPAPKAAKVPATRAVPAGRQDRIKAVPADVIAKVPAGYELLWPKATFGLCKNTGSEGAAWLTLCYAHGTTHEAANARQADTAGTKAERVTWCKGCKADAAKAATAAAKAAADKAAASTATADSTPAK